MQASRVIELLGLVPLPQEGGFYRETQRSALRYGDRSAWTAIYYMITPESFSRLHRLRTDELFHFHAGDPVAMIQLDPAGILTEHRLGIDLEQGERPQVLVPAGSWQGSRLVPGGRWALLGTTMTPGFDFDDYEHGERDILTASHPQHAARLTSYF